VQGADQQLVGAFAQRVGDGERRERGDRVSGAAEGQQRGGSVLVGGEPQVVQPGRRGLSEGCLADVGERLAAPECDGLGEQGERPLGIRGGAGLADQAFEGGRVDLGAGEGVAGRAGAYGVGRAEGGAQAGDPGLRGVRDGRRGFVAPQGVDERGRGDRATRIQREPDEQRAQPAAADLDR